MLAVMGAAVAGLYLFSSYQVKKRAPSPLACDVLREPGHTFLQQIDERGEAVQVCRIAVITVPLLAFAVHVSYSYFAGMPESWLRGVISAALALLFTGYYAFRLLRLVAERRSLRLRYDSEVAVGQELNLLMADGYRVFHDFPADSFKIDHLVVGPTGVMVVETRSWSRNHKRDAIVPYDGRMLHFPKYSDYETIDQANRKAEWFSQWISDAVGEEISARAMVALPGWSVKRTSADGIPVVSPKQFAALFKHIKPRPMNPELMQGIVQQIEARCLTPGVGAANGQGPDA
jgi:predicted ester cyclase